MSVNSWTVPNPANPPTVIIVYLIWGWMPSISGWPRMGVCPLLPNQLESWLAQFRHRNQLGHTLAQKQVGAYFLRAQFHILFHRLSLHLFPPFRPWALLSNILFKSNTNILFKVNTIINRVEEVLWCDIVSPPVVMWWYGKYVVVSVSNNRSYDLGGVEVVDSSKVPCWEHLCHHRRSLRLSGGSEFHLKLCANTFQVLAKQQ